MPLFSRSGGGGQRSLARAVGRVEAAFAASVPSGKSLDRAARDYGVALCLAVDLDPSLAARLFRDYDSRIPADRYAPAFGEADVTRLAAVLTRDDRRALSVVFDVAVRLDRVELQREARDRMADVLGRERDADLLVSYLQRWQELGLLEAATLTRALRGHLTKAPLSRDAQLWSAFFDQLPEALLPELSEVHCFLGRGEDAVRLADTGARRQQALECCADSPRLADVRAGLELARRHADAGAVRRLAAHAGELLFAQGEYAPALAHFRESARPDMVSACHEHLGEFFEALRSCPADQPERLARLVDPCRREVDRLVERREFTEAARSATELADRLARSPLDAAEAVSLRAAVAAEAGRHFGALLARSGEPEARRTVLTAWSRFEEEAGEPGQAAQRAEEAGDLYRAHRLFRSAGHFGDADRVLRGEDTPEGRAARAEARESGGDLVGAAWLYAEAGTQEQQDRAVELFMRAGEYAAGADCLLRRHGDAALADPRLTECLRGAGRVDELVRLCLRVVRGAEEDGTARRGAVDRLRSLRTDPALAPELAAEVERALDEVDGGARRAFEERAQAWVARARAETDRRFAGIWGLDLGTTTCVAALYDSRTRQVVLCPWKGREHFPATLSLDREGNELIGLAREETFAPWLIGHIAASKRAMGTRRTYRIRDRSYRPQEVAARLIRHARGMVESYLAAQVRERVGDLARAELGQVHDTWLSWAEHHHDLRLDRPRAVLTIPAYFLNNQKHATHHACEIAGVEAVRLLHEPTAACLAAGRERNLTGSVAVVDLGAGTLDASDLDVADDVYEVRGVLGDTHFGGMDFDANLSRALLVRLERQGVDVPRGAVVRRRLEVAAEHLKIALSAQEHAEYVLRGFTADGHDVVLELGRAELAEILDEPLSSLRRTCTAFRKSLPEHPDHLVLVGGPMLSPLVRATVEQAIGVDRTVVSDPRTVVAGGAALQAAVIDGKLTEALLLDVTPLPLGIRVVDEERNESFSALIETNTTIPIAQKRNYTTTEDNQSAVRIEVYNGQLDPASQIGQFLLEGIPPAPAGTPEIEVTFSIDANCVLDVTAHDKGTGRSKSITVTDSTLLSPGELSEMTQRLQRQSDLVELGTRLRELVAAAEADDGEASWRELRQRLTAHRPSQAPADPGAQRMLAEIFNESHAVEVELLLVQEPLRNLTAEARTYLGRMPGTGVRGDGETAVADADLPRVRHLVAELDRLREQLRPQLDRLAAWNALLVRLATADPDPLQRFRDAHDAGEYAGALAALRRLDTPPEAPEDLRRRLRCLAEVGDADGYRATLTAHAGLLGATLPDPDRPEVFLDRIRPALVTVTGGAAATGSGFLLSDRLVVTNRHLLADETAPDSVTIGTRDAATRTVDRIVVPDSRHPDIALLRLTEPVPPGTAPDPATASLRLGPARLLRIGDRVWAAGAAAQTLYPGVVNAFEEFAEEGIRLFKIGIRLPAPCSGGPLLNDLGEAVGILTIRAADAPAAAEPSVFALTADSLTPLLAGAGFSDV